VRQNSVRLDRLLYKFPLYLVIDVEEFLQFQLKLILFEAYDLQENVEVNELLYEVAAN